MVNFSSIFVREVYCGDWEYEYREREREEEKMAGCDGWKDTRIGKASLASAVASPATSSAAEAARGYVDLNRVALHVPTVPLPPH